MSGSLRNMYLVYRASCAILDNRDLLKESLVYRAPKRQMIVNHPATRCITNVDSERCLPISKCDRLKLFAL